MMRQRDQERQRGAERRRGVDRQRGQSTVEFALLIPVVVVVLMAFIQVGVVVYTQLAMTHTAREVARGLAVDSAADVGQLASAASPLGTSAYEISASFESVSAADYRFVSVTISYDVPYLLDVFASLLGDLKLQASARMMVE